MPRDLQERTLAVSRETELLSKTLGGRSPKVREVAAALGCSVKAVLEAQEVAASYEAASRDAPTARDDEEAAPLVDMMGGEDLGYELVESRDAIANGWKALPDVEPGGRAALYERLDTAGDRGADWLLPDARVASAAARARPPPDGRSRRLSERAFRVEVGGVWE
jgi:hypothetical protein